MSGFNLLGGVGITSAPLINFDTIIDEDISLLLYILKEVRNFEVFDLDKVDNYKALKDLISEVYHARYDNPLYFLMKDDSKKEFLDQCYNEFMEKPEYLADYAIATDIYELVSKFKSSGEINTTIVYRNKYELERIESDELLSSINHEHISKININHHTQVFVNRIKDAEGYLETSLKRTFYFSSRGSNLNEDKTDLIQSDIIAKLCKFNAINVFDMYKDENIGRSIF